MRAMVAVTFITKAKIRSTAPRSPLPQYCAASIDRPVVIAARNRFSTNGIWLASDTAASES